MKGHNYGLCKKCGKFHDHPRGMEGKNHSQKTRKWFSENRKGENNSFYGRKHSEYTKKLISKSNTGKIRSDELKKHFSEIRTGPRNPFYGKKHTEQTKLAISRNRIENAYSSGENNPCWIDGRSYLVQGPRMEKLKNSIRKRDNYICAICKERQGETLLTVHHIDENKENNESSNLISLCKACHGKLHWGDPIYASELLDLVT